MYVYEGAESAWRKTEMYIVINKKKTSLNKVTSSDKDVGFPSER